MVRSRIVFAIAFVVSLGSTRVGVPDDHWAFRPLANGVERAPIAESDLNSVDPYVGVKLAERGLTRSSVADREVLVRRVTFDLTGLPPSQTEILDFVADDSTDAFERLVDRLLASPRFGERWGKFWLDAAGYADSNGYFNADSDRPWAWRYRDYVIAAHNADKPFDQFLREQLAGDELVDLDPATAKLLNPAAVSSASLSSLIATHFLRNAPDGTGESDGNPDEVRIDRYSVLEGTIQILGSSLFGLTLQCARCHDHKFEPVTQREYYQLQAILFPAYNPNQWVNPNERILEIAGQKISWLTDVSLPPPEVKLLIRGDYKQPGPVVQPDVFAVLNQGHAWQVEPPASGRTTGRRWAFARWLTQPGSPAAALLARVTVNRIWQHHFQNGLVATPENFGYSGAAPTHAALLEYLAGRFVGEDWSMKSLHRLLLTSHTYRQASHTSSDAIRLDPDNRYLSRYPLRRLDAEALRDAMLSVSQELDSTVGGAPVPTKRTGVGEVIVEETNPGFRRRAVYIQQRRTQVETMLATFDAPSIVTNCTRRSLTTTPLQSLSQLNSTFVRGRAVQLARYIARQSAEPEERIRLVFLLTTGRSPNPTEMSHSQTFLREQSPDDKAAANGDEQVWSDFCQILLASNAFAYME